MHPSINQLEPAMSAVAFQVAFWLVLAGCESKSSDNMACRYEQVELPVQPSSEVSRMESRGGTQQVLGPVLFKALAADVWWPPNTSLAPCPSLQLLSNW